MMDQERERKFRRKIFNGLTTAFGLALVVLLFWKLKILILPILSGAFLAYLFRPLKDRVRLPWLPHEGRVLLLFACIGILIFMAINQVRRVIPNERQKLELKVRLMYKLNRKYQEVVGTNDADSSAGQLLHLVAQETGPMMDRLNGLLALTPDEQTLFQEYRKGYKGQAPISDLFYDYYQANLTTQAYAANSREIASQAGAFQVVPNASIQETSTEQSTWLDALSIWILTPLIFIFLGFDNGQLRRYFIGMVPNRYFELSLTVLDNLDVAIGRYLRGTLTECTLVGLTLAIGFILLGIPVSLALAIGLISGMANAIPFLGPAIGLVIAAGYSLIAENITPLIPLIPSHDLVLAVVVLVGITHVLDNAIYSPVVLGSAVNLHPIVVVIAIVSGSVLMGFWGMLLAIPSVVILKTAVETLSHELKNYRII